ncbi:hypothetical protein HanRHA438_Chr13g0604761 [Helianthus annuus]|nr:hypothetical protein HanIR_Chr13g0646321 [Helianthus annuus]KAJ0858759.1 hypothetical protein HanRHA438_Chr13g0604761 [Helianthus annuus]
MYDINTWYNNRKRCAQDEIYTCFITIKTTKTNTGTGLDNIDMGTNVIRLESISFVMTPNVIDSVHHDKELKNQFLSKHD